MTPRNMSSARGQHNVPGVRLLAIMFFTWSLVTITQRHVAGPFAYAGYKHRDSSSSELLLALLATLLLGAIQPGILKKPSDAAFSFLTCTVALPIIWIAKDYGVLDPHSYEMLALITLACFATMRLVTTSKPRPIALAKIAPGLYWGAVSIVLIGTAVAVWWVGLRPSLSSLEGVYEQRADYLEAAGSRGAYLVGLAVNSILPILVAAGLLSRRLHMTAVGGFGYVAALAFTGQKSYFVGFLLVLLSYLLITRLKRVAWGWPALLTTAIWCAALFDSISGSITGTSLIVRRAITTAGMNTAYFFDFFSQQPTYELRHSVLFFLGPPPFSLPPSRIVGASYYGSELTSANANLIADGFANFGISGCLISCFIFGIYLRAYDAVSSRVPLAISAPALMMVLVAVSNTALLTTLLTHGGLALLFVVAAFPWYDSELDPLRSHGICTARQRAATVQRRGFADVEGAPRSEPRPPGWATHG